LIASARDIEIDSAADALVAANQGNAFSRLWRQSVARQEHPREDLMAEATALVERVEIVLTADSRHVVIGFRRDGAASIYFAEDPAFHFNARHELRRAYLAGQLLKADRGRLVSMRRERSREQVQLLSRELDVAETSEIIDSLRRRLDTLAQELDAGPYQVVGQVPPDVDVVGRGRNLLAELARQINVAPSPHAG
jgi:hypothetical protein